MDQNVGLSSADTCESKSKEINDLRDSHVVAPSVLKGAGTPIEFGSLAR